MKRALICLLLASGAAHAEFKDGNRLLAQIRGDSHDYVHAVGYIAGVADALHGAVYCPPPTITAGQITDMVKQHLEASPSVRHLSADQHVTYVLKRAWPCAEQSQRRGNGGQSL
jgi:hypothetical protein